MAITPLNFLNLRDGRFDATSRTQLTQLFDAFAADGTQNMAVHFHGGLVSADNAMATAERLLPEYRQDGVCYPMFFVWESGLFETIRNNTTQIANEEFFQKLLSKALQFVGGKVLQGLGGARGEAVPNVDDTVVEAELAKANQGAFPLMTADRRAAVSELTEAEALQFRDMLEGDPSFMAQVDLISNTVQPADHMAKSRGAEVAGSTVTLMSPNVLADIARERKQEAPGARGLLESVRLVKGGVVVVARVIARFAQKRDHGFYATVVEEILREFYLGAVGETLWGLMKKATADAFAGNDLLFGGTAFLNELKRVDPNNQMRVTLIGHSAGSEYICNLLSNATAILGSQYQFDVVFMAPACRIEFFDDVLKHQIDHLRSLRMFTMFDAVEQQDVLVPLVYPHSLLYFISGVLEDEADKPILGMERYLIGDAPFYQQPETGIPAIRAFFDADPNRKVFSVSVGTPGFETNSIHHGEFTNTIPPQGRATIDSVKFILKNGF